VDHLGEALAEGITVGHADMPEFVLEPDEIDAFIAYLESLEYGATGFQRFKSPRVSSPQ
jgi:mono/diheme cytochrome c family protein